MLSNLHVDAAERARAAGQDVALVDLAVRDAAVVHHMNLALQLANLAGATDTELTGRRNVEAARPRNLENRVGFLAQRHDSRQRQAEYRRRTAYGSATTREKECRNGESS